MVIDVYVEHPVFEINQAYSYICNEFVEVGMRVLVPFGNASVIGLVYALHDDSYKADMELKEVLQVIDKEVLINDEISQLAKYMEKRFISPYMACIQAMLPPYLKPKSTMREGKKTRYVRVINEKMAFSDKEQDCINFIKKQEKALYSSVRSSFGTTPLNLIKKGALENYYEEEFVDIVKEYELHHSPILTKEQEQVINEVKKVDSYQPFLLFGVTGSGKTEVYLQLADEVIKKGKSVIILVPEIGLTPQMIARVKGRFSSNVAIYHSRLSAQEKYNEYNRVKQGKVQVVVGTRSAIFMPFDNIGLIIVDEEHDKSYKQDSLPRYHARDISLFRAKYHNCPVVLASATPSFESFARAKKNVYKMLFLTKRVSTQMPHIEIVDRKEELRNGEGTLLTSILKEKMHCALDNKEQIILLFNRRGYAPQIECKECHSPLKCPHCDITLSYHKEEKKMKCHYCDYEAPFIKICPTCKSNKGLTFSGSGIERLQEEIEKEFPSYIVMRMDRDTTSRKHAHEEIIEKFAAHEADILIGTQMIAKGLDFPSVSLVGIVNADQGMNRPDFRAIEDTYALISQASGRSGRSNKQGEVIIQTYNPDHYMFEYLRYHDYEGFFTYEMKYRHMALYPPYCFIGSIMVMDGNEEKAMQIASDIYEYIEKKQIDGKLYPISDLVKVQDQYRYRTLIKMKNETELSSILYDVMVEFKSRRKVKVKLVIDFEPSIV